MPSDSVFWHNLRVTVSDITTQVVHARSVRGRARTGYYKVAILLSASIVEGLLHKLLEASITIDPTLLSRSKHKEQKYLHTLPKNTLGLTKDLIVCEVETKDFDFSPRTNFNSLNNFCLEVGIINIRLHKSIKYTIGKRNEIHLQGLDNKTRRFNRQMLQKAGIAMEQLVGKIIAL